MDMNPTFYSDDFESDYDSSINNYSLYVSEQNIGEMNGGSGWTPSQGSALSWQEDSNSQCNGVNSIYGSIPGGNFIFDDQATWTSTVALNNMSSTSKATLKFRHKYRLRSNAYALVRISNNNGSTYVTKLYLNNTAYTTCHDEEIILDSFLPSSQLKIQFYIARTFYFNFWGGIGNSWWYIDDIEISKEIPVQESTLAVRVQEASVVVFSGGIGAGFKDGDVLYEEGGRLNGIIEGNPLVTAGDWTSGATGLCTLRDADYDDSKSGSSLKVIGSSTTANLVAYGERENLIRAFIADPTGEGSAGDLGSALDYLKYGHPRRTTSASELQWPPKEIGNWPASMDYFTLVQWDGFNETGTDSDGNGIYLPWSGILTGTSLGGGSDPATFSNISTSDEPYAIIRTNALVSPADTTTSYTHSELGLHAFGDGAENTYFDDFGVRLDIGAQYRYAPVVQE